MPNNKYRVLTEEQVEHFLQRGYVLLRDSFSHETAKAWTDRAFVRLGYDPDDPTTWKEEKIHMPALEQVDVKEFAPTVWDAACDLLGGEERIERPYTWGDGFVLNLRFGADHPWQPPSAEASGWHKDGDFFRHFLDSPEQGLLTVIVWSDWAPQGGGTFIACDSVPVVARFLAAHPEGVLPREIPSKGLIEQCHDFMECTGTIGDVFLLHPFLLHASSQNVSGVPRFMTNPPAHLSAPMCFDREDPSAFSPVEQAILRGLGVERLAFRPSASREAVVPERIARQQRMLAQEKARLSGAF